MMMLAIYSIKLESSYLILICLEIVKTQVELLKFERILRLFFLSLVENLSRLVVSLKLQAASKVTRPEKS